MFSTSQSDTTIHPVPKYRVIQSSDPPSRAEIESLYEKLSNAFSNTIYLKIIWRVSTFRIEYLPHTEPFAKIDSVSFFMCFGHFDSLFRLTPMPLERHNIFLTWMYLIKALLLLNLEWAHFSLNFKQFPKWPVKFIPFHIGKSQKFGHQNRL